MLTCSPARQCTPSSSSCSPGQTAYCESSGESSSESFLHTSAHKKIARFPLWEKKNEAWEPVGVFILPLWEAAGWVASPPLLPKASSRLHWESTLVSTAWRGSGPGGVIRIPTFEYLDINPCVFTLHTRFSPSSSPRKSVMSFPSRDYQDTFHCGYLKGSYGASR